MIQLAEVWYDQTIFTFFTRIQKLDLTGWRMSEVLELLSSELDERHIREIAAHLGTDPSQTEAAISVALPTLVSAFGRSMETQDGAQLVTSQMQGIGGGSLGDLLGGILGNARKRPPAQSPSSGNVSASQRRSPASPTSESFEDILPPGFETSNRPPHRDPGIPLPAPVPSSRKESPLDRSLGPGNELPPSMNPMPQESPSTPSSESMDDILGNVLGGKKKRVEDAIGKSSGLDLRKIGPLLMILAPLVLGAMKARASTRSSGNSKSLNPGDLSDLMRGERSSVEQRPGGSLIGRMLDQDGDGDFDLSDIFKLGFKFIFGRR
jgi:hypothetical protein